MSGRPVVRPRGRYNHDVVEAFVRRLRGLHGQHAAVALVDEHDHVVRRAHGYVVQELLGRVHFVALHLCQGTRFRLQVSGTQVRRVQ